MQRRRFDRKTAAAMKFNDHDYIKTIARIACKKLFSFPGELQPDVNLTVLPGLTFPPLSNITVSCDGDQPRFPNTTNSTLIVRPNNIKIYVGPFEVKECTDTLQCVYTLSTFFPGTPPVISCTARNLNNACRFKVANITLMAGWYLR
jgi:hypothetical protein